MNIFYLDKDINKCAEYHCDKHVVKMITEHTQMLSIACRLSGYDVGYSMGNWKNHPCSIWVRESEDNFIYLADLTEALHKEWQYRYDHSKSKIHGAFEIMCSLPLPKLPSIGFTEPAQAMPEQYKIKNDSITAYRNYYKKEKANIATWKKREKPYWF